MREFKGQKNPPVERRAGRRWWNTSDNKAFQHFNTSEVKMLFDHLNIQMYEF